MWNLIDSSKIVSTQSKVNCFKNHINNIKSMKPLIRIETPWRSNFSLSKQHNKYKRLKTTEVLNENQALINHIRTIALQQRENTLNLFLKTVPSNKKKFKVFKSRERKRQKQEIYKENVKILSKIMETPSFYQKNMLQKEWSLNQLYRNNIIKKDMVPDFYELVRLSTAQEKQRNRPIIKIKHKLPKRSKTAFPR